MSNQIVKTVNENIELLEYLINRLNIKRSKAKALLLHKCIVVNDKIVTKYNFVLHINDTITINLMPNADNSKLEFEIIYEDSDFIVINKPSGLLTISTDKEHEKTAYHMVREYLNDKYEKIFILHRLDKDTSGILVFVKNEDLKLKLQENWDQLVLNRLYYGVVEGKFEQNSGHIEVYLKENRESVVYVTTKDDKFGKLAITDYKVIKSNDRYSLLDISIKTGRKNQIRVSLANIDHPIVSDNKYGHKDKLLNHLALHSYKLEFINPINNKKYSFETPIPGSFKRILKTNGMSNHKIVKR